MKNFTFFLCCIAFALGFSQPLKAQGWEIFALGQEFEHTSQFLATLGTNSGVQIIYKTTGDNENNVANYSAIGEFIGNEIISGTEHWYFIQADSTGAMYWRDVHEIKKINSNDQIEWTHNLPIVSGALSVRGGPNGSIYAEYSIVNDGYVIDVINKDGVLEHRFNFGNENPDGYVPTANFGLMYTNDSSVSPQRIWTRLDNQGNVIWVRGFDRNDKIMTGSSDGSTYFTNLNNDLIKLDISGNIIWTRPLEAISIGTRFDDESFVELSDGNIAILSTSLHDDFSEFVQFIKINGQTGDLIWKRRSSISSYAISHNAGFFEMPDGGLLAAIQISFFFGNGNHLFIMRTDPNGNTITNEIKGKLYQDENGDCQWQDTEAPMKQTSVIAESSIRTYSATTDSLGYFSMTVGGGDYQISYSQLGSYRDFCITPMISLAPSNDTVTFNSGSIILANCPELVVSLGSSFFRRCFDNNYLYIHYQNIGTAAAENAYIDLYLDPQLAFLSSTPVSADQQNQAYRFELGDLDVNESGQIVVNFSVNCDAEMGSILCIDAQIYPDTVCLSTETLPSEDQFCLPVVASFDPNDKTAFVDDKPEYFTILPNQELEYLIRFQNTGNDTAFNIVILDTLDAHLNIASVMPGASSHAYAFELVDGHVLRFSFRNILLPDSTTNEPASHGFVKFWIRQSATNVSGNRITNSAAIYFDFNNPIITNETDLLIYTPVHTKDIDNQVFVQIFPVPAHDRVHVVFNDTNVGTVLWRMFDSTGTIVSTGKTSELTGFDIPRNNLPSGLYYCQFLLETGQIVPGKMIFN